MFQDDFLLIFFNVQLEWNFFHPERDFIPISFALTAFKETKEIKVEIEQLSNN